MSDISFPLGVPPVPIPLISPDEGVPSVPDFQPYSYGSIGESTTGYDVHPSRPNQIGYEQGGGLSVRQFTGSITVANTNSDPTTLEYQTALSNVYSASNPPKFGDLVSLQIAGGTRLVARFWILNNDNVATNATVAFTVAGDSYVGLNLNYTSIEGSIGGIQDYFAGPNGGQDPDGRDVFPTVVAPFGISVDGIYSTDPNGFLVPSSSVTIRTDNGELQVKDNVSDTANGVSSSQSFTAGDGVRVYALYLKAVVSFSEGSVSGLVATQEIRETTTTNLTPVTDMDFNSSGTEGTKYWTIGTVELARIGRRRFARITQMLAGNVKSHAESTATGSSVSGVDTDAGLKQFTICVKGEPYRTFILTGPLYEIT